MTGRYTPDLNNRGRFLRGTDQKIYSYQYQNDMMYSHHHEVHDYGHTHSDRGHDHSYYDWSTDYWEGDNADDRRMVKYVYILCEQEFQE